MNIQNIITQLDNKVIFSPDICISHLNSIQVDYTTCLKSTVKSVVWK